MRGNYDKHIVLANINGTAQLNCLSNRRNKINLGNNQKKGMNKIASGKCGLDFVLWTTI